MVSSKSRKKQKIFTTLMRIYFTTNQPVCSSEIFKALHKNISQSSIRHHLQELVNEGMLLSTSEYHGKFPTDTAIQEYAQQSLLSIAHDKKLDPTKHGNLKERIEKIVKETSSKYQMTVIYSMPQISLQSKNAISSINLIDLSDRRYLAVITSSNTTYSLVEGEILPSWNKTAWNHAKAYGYNKQSTNSCSDNTLSIWKEIILEISKNESEVQHVEIEGISYMFPLMKNMSVAKDILQLADSKQNVLQHLSMHYTNGEHILVGKFFATRYHVFENLAILFKVFKNFENIDFTIGCIGNKTMDFNKALEICNIISSKIKHVIRSNVATMKIGAKNQLKLN